MVYLSLPQVLVVLLVELFVFVLCNNKFLFVFIAHPLIRYFLLVIHLFFLHFHLISEINQIPLGLVKLLPLIQFLLLVII